MENTILTIALSSIDFLNFFEKTRLLKELKAMENAGHCEPLCFLKQASYDQIAAMAGRNLRRPLRAARWNGDEHVRLAKKSAMEARVLGVECLLRSESSFCNSS